MNLFYKVLACLFALLLLTPVPARAAATEDQQAVFVIATLADGCFANFFEQDKIAAWADKNYSRVPDAGAAKFLKGKEGKVWLAHVREDDAPPLEPGMSLEDDPHYMYSVTLVLPGDGTCVLSYFGIEEEAFHKTLRGFAEGMAETMKEKKKVGYQYKPEKEDMSRNFSIISIEPQEGEGAVVIIGNSGETEQGAQASITIKASFDPRDPASIPAGFDVWNRKE